MKVGIYFNKKYLTEKSARVDKISKSLKVHGLICKKVNDFDDLNGLDVLFVLGGDGTILAIASECAKRKIKILGINCGHLGFLAETELENTDEAVSLICNGNYQTQKRSMLEIKVGEKTYYALNDVVVQRSTSGNRFSNTVDLRAEINGSTVDNFTSDGIIVSTPTGSTAYSLAAGGSVMTPDLKAFIMTPICAHSLHSRPVVYSDDSVLKIYQTENGTPLNIVIDGRVIGELTEGATVVIKKADRYAEFITRSDNDFFKKLLLKLNIWSK